MGRGAAVREDVRCLPSPRLSAYRVLTPSPARRRYEEPLPRADGAFVPGIRKFTIQCNIWTLNGLLGRINGIEGAENAKVRQPIADYVKNVLRGRKNHGLKHVLEKEWAKLPA